MRTFNLGHRDFLNWPMLQSQMDTLGETKLVSPRVGNAHGYVQVDEAVYIYQVEQLPALREQVEKNIWPAAYFLEYLGDGNLSPLIRKYLRVNTPTQAADIVGMDHPFDLWDQLVEPYCTDEGIASASPIEHEGNPFVESALRRAAAHQMAAHGLDLAFDVKYQFGQVRPIEFYDPSLERYATPNHPESPAGHGGFSGGTQKAFETLYAPDAGQIADMTFATKQFCMFRSLSAMHIPFSNLLGWQIGYEA